MTIVTSKGTSAVFLLDTHDDNQACSSNTQFAFGNAGVDSMSFCGLLEAPRRRAYLQTFCFPFVD